MTSENTKTTNDSVRQAGDVSFPVTELFFDPDEGVLRYIAIDVGGWFERREAIVAERLIGAPDDANRAWPAEITIDNSDV